VVLPIKISVKPLPLVLNNPLSQAGVLGRWLRYCTGASLGTRDSGGTLSRETLGPCTEASTGRQSPKESLKSFLNWKFSLGWICPPRAVAVLIRNHITSTEALLRLNARETQSEYLVPVPDRPALASQPKQYR
jgi:hypothetical protein